MALALMWVMARFRPRWVAVQSGQVRLSITAGEVANAVLLQVVYQAAFFLALAGGLSPGTLAVILGLQPFVTCLAAGDRLDRWRFAALGLGLLGLVMVVWGTRDVDAQAGWAMVLGFAAMTALALGTAFQRRIGGDPLRSATLQSLVSTLVFGGVVAFTGWDAKLNAAFVLSVIWMAVAVSVVATLLLLVMINRQQASRVGILFYMVPVVTACLDYLVFGTTIGWLAVFGAVMVVMSLRLFAIGTR
ncbi:MAG TPA: DMT family transporter [Pinirhizobacter sp.]